MDFGFGILDGCGLWDFAGGDGLQGAIALFSPSISHLAPFQSLTMMFDQQPCVVLRLCENNFRVVLPAGVAFDRVVTNLGLNVWVKPCQTATFIVPVASGLGRLAQIATTKPLFTLDPFPCDRAVPARIDGRAILAWHHLWEGQPRLLIQTANADVDLIQGAFAASVCTPGITV
ncbi:MAG: hypothetical protein VKK04_13005 [Synechococcales bacterium]|nr:hypothetical protein [Synechococcales bacterium]